VSVKCLAMGSLQNPSFCDFVYMKTIWPLARNDQHAIRFYGLWPILSLHIHFILKLDKFSIISISYVKPNTVPFRPSVQSRVTAEKKTTFKICHKSKENLSAFSETEISKIMNTWSKWYSNNINKINHQRRYTR